MDSKKKIEKMIKQAEVRRGRYDKLSEEERKIIEENKELLTQKVKGMLDEIEYSIIDINTAYSDDLELNNGTTIKAYNTSFISYETLFSVIVTTNAETMEMLHVQTRPTKYMTVNEFFKIEEN